MNDVDKLLQEIREGYYTHLENKSLDSLVTFLSGYYRRTIEAEGIELRILPGFQDFVTDYYHCSNTFHWSSIILSYCHQNGEEAFDRFYALLDIFQEKNNKLNNDTTEAISSAKTNEHFENMLQKIRKRPSMYFGKKTLAQLVTTFSGYYHRAYTTEGIEIKIFPGFQEFVADYCHYCNTFHWSDIIQYYCHQNDEEAFDKFCELLDKYREINEIQIDTQLD